jgi:glycosyltransferase involved in cell wall biosynthesis
VNNEKMKVLLINSVCGFGSTGGSCIEIAKVLESQGDECFIAYGQGTTSYVNSFKIGGKLENHWHNFYYSRLLGKQGYGTYNGTKALISFIEKYEPHVIELHNLHGNYLNLHLLFDFLRDFKGNIQWVLHDCWAITGKCAYFSDVNCDKWQTSCHSCPQIKTYPPSFVLDQSKVLHEDKKKLILNLPKLKIITVSNWLNEQVKKSYLNKFPVYTIHNWIDNKIFRPIENYSNKFGLDTSKFIVLGVSAGFNKNKNKLKDFINLSKMFPHNMQLVLVGALDFGTTIPENIIHINYVHGKENLAELYNIAQVYVHLSTEDTFGKVTAEAMCCGTPVVVYDTTAIPEIVGQGCGFIVPPRDLNAVFESILQIKKLGKESFSIKCREYAINNYDPITNIGKLIDLYIS